MKKLVSDFDGVLTELSHEAQRVKEIFFAKAGLSPAQGAELEASVLSNSSQNGWEVLGRITAYADEDGFILVNGIAAYMDRAQLGRFTLPDGASSFKLLAQHSYEQMVQEVMSSSDSPIDGTTGSVIQRLHTNQTEVVVVSNSGTSRIEDIFKKAKITARAFPHRSVGSVCIRGGARKFELAPEPEFIQVGDRKIDVARPVYETILKEERPDGVVGDVFSLDLALPMALCLKHPELFKNGIKLFLRERPYTPEWVKRFFASSKTDESLKRARVSLHLIQNLSTIAELL